MLDSNALVDAALNASDGRLELDLGGDGDGAPSGVALLEAGNVTARVERVTVSGLDTVTELKLLAPWHETAAALSRGRRCGVYSKP